MLKTAYFKREVTDEETGKKSTVVTEHKNMYEVDAASAVARFPHQWSYDEKVFGQALKPGEAPKSWADEKPAPIPVV